MKRIQKIGAGFLVGGTLVSGGVFAADAQINPYTDKGTYVELEKESTITKAGVVETELSKEEPAVLMKKWGGEASLLVSYEGLQARGERALLTNRMEWKGEKEEMHAYPLEAKAGMEDGGFEIEIVLKEKPSTNVWNFALEGTEDLDFFYQPELNAEALKKGDYRPENVIGSYAVYHKEKKDFQSGSVNYATGKAFHIFRPAAIDANGISTWGQLSYKDGVLSVYIPSDWLAKAAYPVRVDPTFGYTSQGASDTSISTLSSDDCAAMKGTAITGVLTSMSSYLRIQTNPGFYELRLYTESGSAPGTQIVTTGNVALSNTTYQLKTNTLSTTMSGANYWAVAAGIYNGSMTGGFIATDTGGVAGEGAFGTNCTGFATNSNRYSVYATYDAPNAIPDASFQIGKGTTIINKGAVILP